MLTIKQGNTILIEKGGKLVCTGDKACFNKKNNVSVSSTGIFEIGANFWVNAYSEFYCNKYLKFGDDVLIGFHVMFLDTDYHPIFNSQNQRINPDKNTVIGNKVWVASNVTVLKGSQIGNNVIIGAGSLVTGQLLNENSIYGGNPVRPLKSDVTWNLEN